MKRERNKITSSLEEERTISYRKTEGKEKDVTNENREVTLH